MQCPGSSVARREADIPAATEEQPVAGVAKLTRLAALFSGWIALMAPFTLRADFVFAVARNRPGLSRFRAR
jgi:hypothetical protein